MKLPLIQGAYSARSVIANAQRCVNLYAEKNTEDTVFPFTFYPSAGLTLKAAGPIPTTFRGLFTASNGALYGVVGPNVYSISVTFAYTLLGTIADLPTPVSMSDNGITLILVDGTSSGYQVILATNVFSTIPTTTLSARGVNAVATAGTGYVPNDDITLAGGTTYGTQKAHVQVGATLVVSATVAAGGSGGTPGTKTVLGTTGVGTPFQASVTVSGGGAITAVLSILVGGVYTTNPVNIASEPVIGAGLVGAKLSVVMGVQQAGVVFPGGAYSVAPSNPVAQDSTTGIGTGATFTMDFEANGQFFGADKVDYIDTFMIFNEPGTVSFYSTLSNTIVPFDPLYVAGKVGNPDELVGLIVVHREIWLFGSRTTEVWSDVGAANFPFAPIPGVFIQHGCVAKYSIATWDLATFWLSQDKTGQVMVFMGMSYNAIRISTYAIEFQISQYSVISDAVGFIYQQQGHVFYQLTFPTADRTWVYDVTSKEWAEKVSIDNSGREHRHRANCHAFAYGMNLVGDWQNGNLYQLDADNATENGLPIIRRRGFPHLESEGKRVHYSRFAADIEVGTIKGVTTVSLLSTAGDFNLDFNADFGPVITQPVVTQYPVSYPLIHLRWSDDKGRTYGNAVEQSLGATGQYLMQPQWRRLGFARDRVFELYWSTNAPIALNGAFIDVVELGT